MDQTTRTLTNSTDTGGYATDISGKGTRSVDERDVVTGVYSNGKHGSDLVLLVFIPRGRTSTAQSDEMSNRTSTWCEERGGEGVFGIRYAGTGGTYEDQGVYLFESVVGERTSVRLPYFQSTDPEVKRPTSNLWSGYYKANVCHVVDGDVIAGSERYFSL